MKKLTKWQRNLLQFLHNRIANRGNRVTLYTTDSLTVGDLYDDADNRICICGMADAEGMMHLYLFPDGSYDDAENRYSNGLVMSAANVAIHIAKGMDVDLLLVDSIMSFTPEDVMNDVIYPMVTVGIRDIDTVGVPSEKNGSIYIPIEQSTIVRNMKLHVEKNRLVLSAQSYTPCATEKVSNELNKILMPGIYEFVDEVNYDNEEK